MKPGEQLYELARPFPQSLVKQVQKGGGRSEDYVPWYVTVQRLISIVGNFDFDIKEVKFTDMMGEGYPTRCTVVGSLTCTIDGFEHTVENVGTDDGYWTKRDKQKPLTVDNRQAWMPPEEKTAASDSIKRCAALLPLGLHLWTKGEYFLLTQLDKESGDS